MTVGTSDVATMSATEPMTAGTCSRRRAASIVAGYSTAPAPRSTAWSTSSAVTGPQTSAGVVAPSPARSATRVRARCRPLRRSAPRPRPTRRRSRCRGDRGGTRGQVVDRESVHAEVRRDRVVDRRRVDRRRVDRSRIGPNVVVQIDQARNADSTMPLDLRMLGCAVADDADDEAVLDDDRGSFDDSIGQHRPDIGDAVVLCNLRSGRFHAPHDGRGA